MVFTFHKSAAIAFLRYFLKVFLKYARISFSQLAEALFEYGRGNDKQALDLLDSDFDANYCKVLLSSWFMCMLYLDIYTFEFKDMNFTVLCARCSGHQMNNLMYLMKSGTACY